MQAEPFTKDGGELMRRSSLLLLAVAAFLSGSWTLNGPMSVFAAEPGGGDRTSEAQSGIDQDDYPPGYIEEAPLPEGFPAPSAVGKIVEKNYPLCRTYSAQGNDAFMRCFAYLAKQEHEMTAPVVVDYKQKADAPESQSADFDFMNVARMHFVLKEPSLDEPDRTVP
jgi:hypothetical protein